MRIDRFYRDLLIVAIGIALSVWLTQAGFIEGVLASIGKQAALASFIAGVFFTSVFTIAPATAVLAALTQAFSTLPVALWGALGATFGDALLFLFVRDVFADDLRRFFKKHHVKLMALPHLGFMRWVYPVVGALIIASPLPDELGLTLLGLTKTKLVVFLPIALVMNFLGILLIGEIAGRF